MGNRYQANTISNFDFISILDLRLHNNDKLKLMKSFSLFLEDTALINAKWLLLRPIEHYRQVHEHDEDSKKKKKVPNIQPPSSFFKKRESSSQSVVEG